MTVMFRCGVFLCVLTAGANISQAQTRSVAGPPQNQVTGPSFNCAKATTEYEKVVCKTPELAAADRALAAAYRAAVASHPLPTYVRERQRVWLQYRSLCLSSSNTVRACLDEMNQRVAELKRQPTAVYTDAEGGAFSYKSGDVVFELFQPTADGEIPINVWGGARILRSASAYTDCDGRGVFNPSSGRVTFDSTSSMDEQMMATMDPSGRILIVAQDVSCSGFAGFLAKAYPIVQR
jgi:uncharacterized protein